METNPFASPLFDEDTVPLDLLQAMGRCQVSNAEGFVQALRLACESATSSVQATESGSSGIRPPPIPPRSRPVVPTSVALEATRTGSSARPGLATQPQLNDCAYFPNGFDLTNTYRTGSPAQPVLAAAPEAYSAAPRDILGDSTARALKIDIPTFQGRSDANSPAEFLQKLSRYATAVHRDRQWLLQEILPVALVGDAQRWWVSRGGYTIWDGFQQDFLKAFGDPDRQRRLRLELETRTQHQEEDLGSFVRVIRAYSERLGSPESEEELVERVLAQVTPFTRQALLGRTFTSLRELEDVGPEIQDLVWRNLCYRPPPLPDTCLERDLAFYPTRTADKTEAPASSNSPIHRMPVLPRARNNDLCNRCGGRGHWARQCPSTRTGPTTNNQGNDRM